MGLYKRLYVGEFLLIEQDSTSPILILSYNQIKTSDIKPIYTSIPVELCKYSLKHRKVNHLILYIYLKHSSSGYVSYGNGELKVWACEIRKSERWVKNAIKWLIQNKWITVDSKRKAYRVIGYHHLHKKLHLHSKASTKFDADDFSTFRGFCCASVITYHMKLKRFGERKGGSVSLMADTPTNSSTSPKGFYTMPISYLAKCMNVSPSMANKYKKCAIEAGYIEVRRSYIDLVDGNGNKLTKDHLHSYRKNHPHIASRLRTGTKHLKIVDADLIRSGIIGKKKRLKYA